MYAKMEKLDLPNFDCFSRVAHTEVQLVHWKFYCENAEV